MQSGIESRLREKHRRPIVAMGAYPGGWGVGGGVGWGGSALRFLTQVTGWWEMRDGVRVGGGVPCGFSPSCFILALIWWFGGVGGCSVDSALLVSASHDPPSGLR